MNINLPVNFFLVNDEECLREYDELVGIEYPVIEGAVALTSLYEHPHDCAVCVVFFPKLLELEPLQIMFTLVHESVHVFDFIMEYLGVHPTVDKEIRAYSIESIYAQLWDNYCNLKKAREKCLSN